VAQPASSAYTLQKKFSGSFSAPDEALCVGNGYVMEVVNMYLTVRRAKDSPAAAPLAMVSMRALRTALADQPSELQALQRGLGPGADAELALVPHQSQVPFHKLFGFGEIYDYYDARCGRAQMLHWRQCRAWPRPALLTLVSSTPPTPHAGVYDKQTRRWYIATLRMTPEQNTTITVVASASSNPLGQYYAYDIDSNYAGKFPDKTCPPPHGCWSDFTTMGADANGIWCAPRARLLPRRAAARSWLPCCEGCAGAKQQAATWCRIAVDVLHDFTVMDYMVGRLLGPAAAGWWRLAGGEH
jgi:hypothetical protein